MYKRLKFYKQLGFRELAYNYSLGKLDETYSTAQK